MVAINRKTIELKIITAVPNNNETALDCGLPFYGKGEELARQIGELSERMYTVIVRFAERMALLAYGGRRK